MFLKRMRLQHFGAFEDTGWITFSNGVNLIVGQNNAGKSSLFKSLATQLANTPHISLDAYRAEDLKHPEQDLELIVAGHELRRALLRRGGTIYWPLSGMHNEMASNLISEKILGSADHLMKCQRIAGGWRRFENAPTHSGFEGQPTHFIELVAEAPIVRPRGRGTGHQDSIVDLLPILWENVFIFDAERIGVGQSPQNEVDRLSARAENLPAFLHIMRGRRPRLFDRLVEHVRSILPTVHSLTTTSIGQSETRILVWPTEHMDKEQFSFPLSASGTGVGQVVAILAAAMSSDPTIFVIDEINTFLHPAAVKSLLRLLQNSYGYHQYIISTHSPEVISSGGVGAVYLVKRNGMESSVQPVDMNEISHLREMADHIGISVGDVFAADHVLWVEGRTEELCFSLLRDWLNISFPPNTIISPIVATGDFFSKKRDVSLVFQVYERLTKVSLPLVRSVAFSFDAESLTAKEIADTRRRAEGKVRFLPRRHLECYLVVPQAIAVFANESDLERQEDYSIETIDGLLKVHAGDPKYLAQDYWKGDLTDQNWLTNVDAANLICDVLKKLTDERVTFNKVDHSARLLEAIIKIDPTPIAGLVTYLEELSNLLETLQTLPSNRN